MTALMDSKKKETGDKATVIRRIVSEDMLANEVHSKTQMDCELCSRQISSDDVHQ